MTCLLSPPDFRLTVLLLNGIIDKVSIDLVGIYHEIFNTPSHSN